MTRDRQVEQLLADRGVPLRRYKDQVIFHKDEILTAAGTPYSVYTPYSRAWLTKYRAGEQLYFPSEQLLDNLLKVVPPLLTLDEIGFGDPGFTFPRVDPDDGVIAAYHQTRDLPALQEGVTRMGVHLRFGTISIRKLALRASLLNETYLKELIWREFFMQVLWHFPYVAEGPF